MAKMYYDSDADLGLLEGKRVAILGYGSQGHAHAQNLRDSGIDVIVANRPGSANYRLAKADGFEPVSVREAAAAADVIVILLPDQVQAKVYEEDIKPELKEGKTLVFSHGFNIHFHQIVPPEGIDVFMVAPKSPGHIVRRMYQEGQGVPALIAVHQDASGRAKEVGLAYAKGIGCNVRASLRPLLRKKQRPTSSVSKSSFAAALPSWFEPALRRWSKRAISRRRPTLSACTN